ncbi:MAG: hypothetical protein KF724_08015 [Phycisphaeraceae bacterium]|nr:hypothetical protein [Phycisphaeraceae bacterium]
MSKTPGPLQTCAAASSALRRFDFAALAGLAGLATVADLAFVAFGLVLALPFATGAAVAPVVALVAAVGVALAVGFVSRSCAIARSLAVAPSAGARLAVDVQPSDTDDPAVWTGIATTPIMPGKFGRVCLSGVTQAIVVVTDDEHTTGRLANGEPYLTSAVAGPASILWRESGTGTKKALVALGIGAPPGIVASGQIVAVTEAEDEATLGFLGYIVRRHQNAAVDLFAAGGTTIPCVNSFELSSDLQDQVAESVPGGSVSLRRLPTGTLVGPIVKLPMPAELGELWMFTMPNGAGHQAPPAVGQVPARVVAPESAPGNASGAAHWPTDEVLPRAPERCRALTMPRQPQSWSSISRPRKRPAEPQGSPGVVVGQPRIGADFLLTPRPVGLSSKHPGLIAGPRRGEATQLFDRGP